MAGEARATPSQMDDDSDLPETVGAVSPATPRPPPKSPWHLPWIAVGAAIWSLLGLFDLIATLTHFGPYMNQLPEAAQAFIYSLPLWVLGLRGAALLASLAGAVLLFRKQRLAMRVLAGAAGATLLSTAISFTRPGAEDAQMAAFAVCIVVISVLLFYYAYVWAKRGVLRAG